MHTSISVFKSNSDSKSNADKAKKDLISPFNHSMKVNVDFMSSFNGDCPLYAVFYNINYRNRFTNTL